ncbi:MAG: hypothetical protein M0T74_03190 [Desulfitobacterium hafniense]|nr:hypothetical protein [Desulfitobacterium hafniense]
MFEFIRKSPFGFLFAAAALVLTVSPEARAATRRAAVKGTAVLLDLVDQAKNSPSLMSQLNQDAQVIYQSESYPQNPSTTMLPLPSNDVIEPGGSKIGTDGS